MDDLPAGDLNNGGVQLQIPESELLLQQVSSPVVEKVASQDNIFWHTSPPLEKLKALAMLKQKENVPSPNTEISCLMNMLAQKASPMNTMDTGDIGIGSSAGQYSSDRKRRMCRDQTPLNTKNSFKDAFPSPFCISTPLHSKGISHTEKKKKLDKTPQIPGSNTSDDICSKAKLLDLVNSINTIFQSESLGRLSYPPASWKPSQPRAYIKDFG
ncbi:hypothetical protein BC829DRAFT_178754 [Chytridium lagenaria]|nr:hypothetical protein BC829DRAFT_178754 [Chytridium lagenaria]